VIPSGGHQRKAVGVLVTAVSALILIAAARPSGQAGDADNAIARLSRKLADGTATLQYTETRGYLPSLLDLLGIDVDSQVLVFSKTSFQHTLINPKNPRALYFNDDVAVGMVPGGTVYEILAQDPSAGLAFYSLDTKKADRPVFQRRGVECLSAGGGAAGT
jgi:hypothetical protein